MPRRDTRTEILVAAESVGRRVGLSRTTTKAVAAEAGCSEASIYYHFQDRTDLLAEVVARRIHAVNERLGALPKPKTGSLVARLRTLIDALSGAFTELVGLSSSLLADPIVLERFRAVLEEQDVSAHALSSAVADRLREEQTAGRVRPDADVEAVAMLIVGTCHETAFHAHLMGEPDAAGPGSLKTVADSLAQLLAP